MNNETSVFLLALVVLTSLVWQGYLLTRKNCFVELNYQVPVGLLQLWADCQWTEILPLHNVYLVEQV